MSVTPFDRDRIQHLHAAHLDVAAIHEITGIHHNAIRAVVDPGYRQRCRDNMLRGLHERPQWMAQRIAIARKRRIEDGRDLTGQLMGDPLPGRSALDHKLRFSGGATERA